jgi:hypothetical protein
MKDDRAYLLHIVECIRRPEEDTAHEYSFCVLPG